MQVKSLKSLAVVAGLALTAGCSDAPIAPTGDAAAIHAGVAVNAVGTALFFNGVDANASTPLGSIVTTQIDNMILAATVRYDGPNANAGYQMIVYNGHGGRSGWGILVLGSADGLPDGTIAILAGGIVVATTPFVLPRGEWAEVYAERKNGNVTVRLNNTTYDLGLIPVTPLGSAWASIERTSVGGDGLFDTPSGMFHGAIKRVAFSSGGAFIELWRFAGSGTTLTGKNGTVIHLGTAQWI